MRFSRLTLFILISSLALTGCNQQNSESAVTPQFLLDRGFSHSATDPTLYELKNVTVGDAAQRLGFNPKNMTHGTNNPPDQDIRLVIVRDYEFALVSNPQTTGNAQTTLDNTNALCTVEARLIPQLHRAPTK